MDKFIIAPENISVISGSQGSGKTTLISMISKVHSAEVFKASTLDLMQSFKVIVKLNPRYALILIDEVDITNLELIGNLIGHAKVNPNWQFMLFTNQPISFNKVQWQKAWFLSAVTSEGLVSTFGKPVPRPGLCKACKCDHLVNGTTCKYDKFCINKQKIRINGAK